MRYVSSFAPYLWLVRSPEDRPLGISALVRVKDEETWLEASLRSSRDLFDEYVVVDNGSRDRSRTILEELKDSGELPITLLESTSQSFAEVSNLALHNARFRWIIRWDADFIAWTRGPRAAASLREKILALPTRRYSAIFLTAVNLVGDLWHHFPNYPIHSEEYLFIYSPSLYFKKVMPRAIEALKFPKYYSVSRWAEPWFLHVDVKPMLRHFTRSYWDRWVMTNDFQTYPTLDDFVLARIPDEWSTKNLREAASLFVNDFCKNLVPYDPTVWGEHPEILRPYLEDPQYRVVYEGGKIIGRNDALDYLEGL